MFRLTFLVILMISQSHCWFNQYDQPFTFTCPDHQFLSRIESIHDNHREDRVFNFQCKQFESAAHEGCTWSAWANDYDSPLIFQCPHGGAITGISSVHDNHNEDRRYKFQCCELTGMCMQNCYFSGFQNQYDHLLDYTVPQNYVLRGVDSVHDNGHEDRMFQFELCEMRECAR